MKHLFVPYTLALLAKEKGFDEPCLACVFTNIEGTLVESYPIDQKDFFIGLNSEMSLNSKACALPLYQQLVDWFESKGIFINVSHQKISFPEAVTIFKPEFVRLWNANITKACHYERYEFRHIEGLHDFKTKSEALNASLTQSFKLI